MLGVFLFFGGYDLVYFWFSHNLLHFYVSLPLQTILFSTDESILEAVSKNDEAFEGEMLSDAEEDVPFERPSTADNEEDDEVGLVAVYFEVLKKV